MERFVLPSMKHPAAYVSVFAANDMVQTHTKVETYLPSVVLCDWPENPYKFVVVDDLRRVWAVRVSLFIWKLHMWLILITCSRKEQDRPMNVSGFEKTIGATPLHSMLNFWF